MSSFTNISVTNSANITNLNVTTFTGASSNIISTNSIATDITTPTYGSSIFNFSFISDGTYWYEII